MQTGCAYDADPLQDVPPHDRPFVTVRESWPYCDLCMRYWTEDTSILFGVIKFTTHFYSYLDMLISFLCFCVLVIQYVIANHHKSITFLRVAIFTILYVM